MNTESIADNLPLTQHYLQAILDHSSDGILLTDENGQVIVWNHGEDFSATALLVGCPNPMKLKSNAGMAKVVGFKPRFSSFLLRRDICWARFPAILPANAKKRTGSLSYPASLKAHSRNQIRPGRTRLFRRIV